ncbi:MULTISPECIES: CRISPR-associated endonuclease Cas2 [Bacillus cereus group]|uniref:CRISPR-associated endonuclease Cas2 n=1 Tax=Bacillus cereus group TaxID=86661 RepID=UPI0005C9FCFF|nr:MULTISPECIES: CRISPR-associated endonuclease Cas2 [Bacillus cereus group]MBG9643228.1 CRISPR-associated protein Cas2 [Bacillus thuringiensis]MBG9649320.1 CRISPR-associated protein Cas2 [Bacillus thuringiensis]MBJ8126603.1 CRISPR-associated endonuclease Cas2 [Bacillus cereus]MEB8874750.1 CRISPR-associated endonuclease Cas2 [Bacillus cereus]MEB9618209.1 CRISPR-associated endonuclease Cas2 [Bacillus cereus]
MWRKVSKTCQNYGQRVQNSVFECVVDAAQFATLKMELIKIIDEDEDSLRFYQLGNNYKNKVEHIGIMESVDLESPLIF